jgi:uridine monophosphate synthetase
MTNLSNQLTNLSTRLFEAGCVKFGTFTLKSGLTSPIYIDLRLLVSHPRLLSEVSRAMTEAAHPLSFDRIAAIPYAALPIGVAMALEMERPMIYPRREAKKYGTRRAIEGAFEEGETMLLVDDLITRGGSKLEAIEALESAGLVVEDVLVLIDREQGGAADLEQRGYHLHAILRLSQMLDALRDAACITEAQHAEVSAYLRDA